MIKIGDYNRLKIARELDFGLFLEDQSGEEVLLPNKYCPNDSEIGNEINVFVYLDKSDRKVATTQIPKITLGKFGYLQVETVTDAGAFLYWGMDKHLYVPGVQQQKPMVEGQWYFVFLLQDETTGKLFGTSKVERYFEHDELTIKVKDKVDLLVYEDAGLGYSVIINDIHKGLVYKNELFKNINIGDRVEGYIKNIREDNKIDVSLQPIGYRESTDPNAKIIIAKLEEYDGFLPMSDKSSPEEIKRIFGISKKAFKKALGALYKEHKIEIKDSSIKLLS